MRARPGTGWSGGSRRRTPAIRCCGEDGRSPTVRATLDALRRQHPGLYDRIVTERHELRPHVNVFVGHDDIRWSGGFGTRIPAGSEVVVLPSVSGG